MRSTIRRSMPALSYVETGRMALVDEPVPEAGVGETLVRVRVSGICGSEVHGVRSRDPFRVPPLVMGHEFAGIRVDTRERVVVNPLLSCSRCEACASGRENICARRQMIGVHRPGGFARLVAVPTSALHPLPPDLTWEAAALVEPLANAVHGWRLLAPPAGGERIGVIGAGAIGLMALYVALSQRPDIEVHVADLSPRSRAVAARLGATSCASELHGEFDIVVEAVGSGTTRCAALDVLRSGGTALWFGLHDDKPGFDARRLVRQEQRVLGSFAYNTDDFTAAIGLAGRVDTSWLTLVDVDQAAAVFHDLMEGRSDAVKAVITFPGAG